VARQFSTELSRVQLEINPPLDFFGSPRNTKRFRLRGILRPFLAANGVCPFWGKFGGTVLGGSIFNNGNNTFTVSVTLELKSGGTGQLLGAVVLDHNDFPPTVEGKLSQP
jgi:hypothetical protein